MKTGRSNRTLRGKLVRPKKQIQLAFAMLSFGLLFLAIPLAVITVRVMKFISDIEASNPIVAVYLTEFTAPALKMVTAYSVVFGVFALGLGILLSHKIYGPLVPILRHAEKLKNGDYSSRIHLRANDEFGDLADVLNAVAEGLESKQQQKGS